MKSVLRKTFIFFVFSILLASFSEVYAVDIPPSDTAGAEQERFQKETEIDNALREIKKKSDDSSIEEAESLEKKDAGKKFELKGIKFTGNESISTPELEAVVSDWIHKQVSFQDLKKISSQVKTYYRERKFTAAYVYMPPQKIAGGIVELQVIEGRLGTISIEDNRWYSERVIRRFVDLRSGDVLYFPKLKSTVNFFNKQPDMKARAVLKPGAEKKTTDLVLKIKDKFPLHLNTDVNNLGTKNTGITRWGIGVTHNNLLGQMDRFSSKFQIGSGAWAVGNQYNIPVGPYRTNIGFSHSHSSVHLGGDFKELNIRGTANTYGVEILQPVKVVSFLETSLMAGFDIKSVENKILGQKAGKDELRILNTGINLEEEDSMGRTYFPHSFHIGFADFLGSSNTNEPAATRAGTGGQFFAYRSTLIRYQRLPAGITYTFRGNVQLTPDRLAPSEQLRLGGAFSVRGYAEGDYLADYGGYVTNEIAVPSYFFPSTWRLPYSKEPLRQQLQAIGFFDMGAGKLLKPMTGENESKMLAGIGGGFKLHLFDRVYGRFQWGGRLGDKASDGKNGAFYYGISADVP